MQSVDELLDPKHKLNFRWMMKCGFPPTDVNAKVGNRSETAMHRACRDGNLPIAKWLHKRGASISETDHFGNL